MQYQGAAVRQRLWRSTEKMVARFTHTGAASLFTRRGGSFNMRVVYPW
jgi:hypothetical protein